MKKQYKEHARFPISPQSRKSEQKEYLKEDSSKTFTALTPIRFRENLHFSSLSEKLSALSRRFLERYSPAEPIAMFHSI